MFTNYRGVNFPIVGLTNQDPDPKKANDAASDTVEAKLSTETQYFPDFVYYSKDNSYVTIKKVLEDDLYFCKVNQSGLMVEVHRSCLLSRVLVHICS